MAKTRHSATSLKTQANEEIKRLWGDIEVVDAKEDLRVFIQPQDFLGAVRKDPKCCAFAKACQRQFASTKVMFFLSVAYMDLPYKNGKRRVERFTLPPDMRELIENFDKKKPVDDFAGFKLKATRPSCTFEKQAARARERHQRIAINGTAIATKRVGNKGKGKYSRPPLVIDLEVRNGSGRVAFKKKATNGGPGR